MESFHTKKEIIKAEYSAAEAQVKIAGLVTGISEEMTDASLAIARAEEKTDDMKSRSAALDELLNSGTLTDLYGESELEQVIAQVKARRNVNDELARMKVEMRNASSVMGISLAKPNQNILLMLTLDNNSQNQFLMEPFIHLFYLSRHDFN